MKKIELKKVDVNALRSLFERSLIVNSILNFQISSSKISSLIENDANTFFKEWETSTEGIFESEEFESLDILIYNGTFFVKNVLSYFSKSENVKLIFNLDNEEKVGKIDIEDSKLKVSLNTTNIAFAGEKITGEQYKTLFSKENAITSFDLSHSTLVEINKLKELNYNTGDKPAISLTFEGKDGKIKVYDESFDLTISSEYSGSDFEVKISKKLLSLINSEDNIVYLCDIEQEDGSSLQKFVFVSKHSSIKAYDIAILMKELDTAQLGEGSDDSGWSF